MKPVDVIQACDMKPGDMLFHRNIGYGATTGQQVNEFIECILIVSTEGPDEYGDFNICFFEKSGPYFLKLSAHAGVVKHVKTNRR